MERKMMSNPVSSQVNEVKSNTGRILFILFILFALIFGGIYYLITSDVLKSDKLEITDNSFKGELENSYLNSKGNLKIFMKYIDYRRVDFVSGSAKSYVEGGECLFVEYKNLDKNSNSSDIISGQRFSLEFDCDSNFLVGNYFKGNFYHNIIDSKLGIKNINGGNFEFKVIE